MLRMMMLVTAPVHSHRKRLKIVHISIYTVFCNNIMSHPQVLLGKKNEHSIKKAICKDIYIYILSMLPVDDQSRRRI